MAHAQLQVHKFKLKYHYQCHSLNDGITPSTNVKTLNGANENQKNIWDIQK